MNAGLMKFENSRIKENSILHIDSKVLEAIENIKATLHIEKKKGNPNADFILRRMR